MSTITSYPRVSVGMPIYNGMPLLTHALDSLLSQTFQNFELIISDNASTDRTSDVCEDAAARDPRVRYIRQPVNLGMVRNFDFVLRAARAPYFMWAAHDDEWDQHYIEYLKANLDSNSGCVGAFGSWCGIDETGNLTVHGAPLGLDHRLRLKRLRTLTFSREDKCIYGLFRTSAIRHLNIRPWRLAPERAEEHTHTWLFYLVSLGAIAECRETTFFYRAHPKPDFPPSAMLRVKLNQIMRTTPAVWRATSSPYLTVRVALENLGYQARNFVWMLLKYKVGMTHATRAEAMQELRRCLHRHTSAGPGRR